MKETNVGDIAIRALHLLKEHERAIGRLYAAYARRFPQEREFWLELSQEERQHAGWIESLQLRAMDDSSGPVANRFPTAAIELSLAYVHRLIENAAAADLTRVNALSIALDLERSLLEHKYFEVFAGDDPELRRTLHLLEQSTRTHLHKVRHAWENCVQMSTK